MEIFVFNTWVSQGCDYNAGVNLYNQHGSNNTLKKLFASGANAFTRKKLFAELEGLSSSSSSSTEVNNTINTTNQDQQSANDSIDHLIKSNFKQYRTAAKPRINPDTLPESLKTDYYNLGPVFNKMRFLHSRLDTVTTDDERFKLAAEIVKLALQRRSIFTRIDYFLENGTLMELPAKKQPKQLPDASNKTQLFQELLRLRSQRSKLKVKPNRQADYLAVLDRIKTVEGLLND